MEKVQIVTRKSGVKIADDYIRVVHGGRGDYVEFNHDQIDWNQTFIPSRQLWRKNDPNWTNKVFYIEHRTKKDYVKIYEQKRLVNYADYKIGLYYISPKDIRKEKK